jgi:hypothetical protein
MNSGINSPSLQEVLMGYLPLVVDYPLPPPRVPA